MKLPRNLSYSELIQALKVFGYQETRQKGSHIHLTTNVSGEHHLVVPAHDSIKPGTLTAIIRMVGNHFGLSRDEVLEKLWGN
jgi:predicted RNA binding protein YcfA (HicA-like mRNA interferase family)